MTPPVPKALRRKPPRPGEEQQKNGHRNGRNGAPATKPTNKETTVEGVAGVVG